MRSIRWTDNDWTVAINCPLPALANFRSFATIISYLLHYATASFSAISPNAMRSIIVSQYFGEKWECFLITFL